MKILIYKDNEGVLKLDVAKSEVTYTNVENGVQADYISLDGKKTSIVTNSNIEYISVGEEEFEPLALVQLFNKVSVLDETVATALGELLKTVFQIQIGNPTELAMFKFKIGDLYDEDSIVDLQGQPVEKSNAFFDNVAVNLALYYKDPTLVPVTTESSDDSSDDSAS